MQCCRRVVISGDKGRRDPGLTVRNRLQVLIPSDERNYYEEFNVVPGSLRETQRPYRAHKLKGPAIAGPNEATGYSSMFTLLSACIFCIQSILSLIVVKC
jgi:hypothetical protein